MNEIEIRISANISSKDKLVTEVAKQLQDYIASDCKITPRIYLTVNDGEKDIVLPLTNLINTSMDVDYEKLSINFAYYV